MISPLLLLVVLLALYRLHVRWGRADLRKIELQSDHETWDDIRATEAEDEIAAEAARAHASRTRTN